MNGYVSSIYNENNDIFALPQTYQGINFYPIKVKEVEYKQLLYRLFFHPKNYIPDKQILKTSYLKFLLYLIQGGFDKSELKINIQEDLIKFMKHVTHRENIRLSLEENDGKDENIFNRISIYLMIDDKKFTEQDFDNIREIILEQNGSSIEYIEEYNPQLEERLSFMNRNSLDINFNDEIFSFCALTGMTEEEVGERTLYQFKCRFEREMVIKDYELFKPLEVSGQISSKSGDEIFKHYLSHISKAGRYGSILIDKNKFLENSGLDKVNDNGNINV